MISQVRDGAPTSDRAALVAAAVALPVSIAAAGTTVAAGKVDTLIGILCIAVPGIVAAIAAVLATNVLVIRRHRRIDHASGRSLIAMKQALSDEKQERAVLRELDINLDTAVDEESALEVVRESFDTHLGRQPMELHLVDPTDPVLELALATGQHTTMPSTRSSPWDSLAAQTDTTLVYESTDVVDVCPHLASRVDRPMAAVAVPVNATGRLLGVLYGFGREGCTPGTGDVRFIEDLANVIGARLAVLRASENSSNIPDDIDRLTGLPDRGAMQDRLLRMLRDRLPFTVAVADIDGFRMRNEVLGRDAGDRALQLLGRVARKATRPGDIIGRIGGDEFLFVLPRTNPDDAIRAFERLRESLVLSQSDQEDPAFTLSIGVIGSNSGGTIEEILHRAASALDHAKSQGGNRVIVAHAVRDTSTG